MNEILVISNDANDTQLIDLAYQFAYQNSGNLTIGHTYSARLQPALVRQNNDDVFPSSYSEFHLQDVSNDSGLVNVKTLDISRYNEAELAVSVWKKGISLVIARSGSSRSDLQVLLNKLHCPLLLLPKGIAAIPTTRVVYLTDLRYCQRSVLTQLSSVKQSSLLIAHVCQQGLPDLTANYGKELFATTVTYHKGFSELFYSHIQEKNFTKITDTLVSTMKADMLVCQNRQYHFQKLIGESVPEQLPEHITVPVLIFPC